MIAQVLRFPSGRRVSLDDLPSECSGTTQAGACQICGESNAVACHELCKATVEVRCPAPGAFTARVSRKDGTRPDVWLRRERINDLDDAWTRVWDQIVPAPSVPVLVQIWDHDLVLQERHLLGEWPEPIEPACAECDDNGCGECMGRP